VKQLFNEFMVEVQQWVAEGCPLHPVFWPHLGLCASFEWFCRSRGAGVDEGFDFAQKQIFKKVSFPFNSSRADYRAEYLASTMYKNPRRLAFINNWEPLK